MSRTRFQVAIFIISLIFLMFVGVIAPTAELIVAYNLHMLDKLSDWGIFETRPHTTGARLRNYVVQIMASQRTLDTWLPAAKKKKTGSDRR